MRIQKCVSRMGECVGLVRFVLRRTIVSFVLRFVECVWEATQTRCGLTRYMYIYVYVYIHIFIYIYI